MMTGSGANGQLKALIEVLAGFTPEGSPGLFDTGHAGGGIPAILPLLAARTSLGVDVS